MMKNLYKLKIYISSLLFLSSCGFYSFNGASISQDIKSVSVQYFPNRANTIVPSLSQVFTEKLKDYILEQTNLELETLSGDIDFSGEIIKYEIKPMAIQANEQAAQNRLTITIKLIYTNNKDITKNFEKEFSRYSDYMSTQSLNDIENSLIEQITSELSEDIFNKTFVNW